MTIAREDAEVYEAIARTIRAANRLFFGPFAPLAQEGGSVREEWESRVAELNAAQDVLFARHAAKKGSP